MRAPPRDIRLFERLAIGSLLIGLAHAYAAFRDVGVETPLTVVIGIALVLAASRLRWIWARWLVAIVAGSGLVDLMLRWDGFMAVGWPAITVAVYLAQAVAAVLLFTRQSRRWFRFGVGEQK